MKMRSLLTVAVFAALCATSSANAAVHLRSITHVGRPKADPGFAADMKACIDRIKVDKDLPLRGLLETNAVKNGYVLPGDVAAANAAPYGHVQWVFYVGWGDGGTKVAMSRLSGMLRSSDSNNDLGKVFSFDGTTYSDLAIGVNAGQPDITSGSASQEVDMFIVAVAFKSYVATEQAVANFVYALNNPAWSLTGTATLQGVTDTFTLELGALGLWVTYMDNSVLVSATTNSDPRNFELIGAPAFDGTNTVWTSLGTLRAGQTKALSSYTNNEAMAFVQLRYLPTSASGLRGSEKVKSPPVADLSV